MVRLIITIGVEIPNEVVAGSFWASLEDNDAGAVAEILPTRYVTALGIIDYTLIDE